MRMIMSFADNMRIWSNINCGLASMVSYGQMRLSGASPYYATAGLFGNLANGVMRNEIAYHMQLMGNPVGNNINMFAGYGNPMSNAIGTLGIMSSCSPWMFFNMGYCNPMQMYMPFNFGHFGFFG
jgi:hypothetical protein